MESSVHLCAVFEVWNTFGIEMRITTTPPRIFAFPGDMLWKDLGRFLHCHLLQMVFVKVKTAGYHS